MTGIMKKIATMTTYKSGDVILLQFPFSDLSSSKKRPAGVLVAIPHRKELIVVMLTSTKKVDEIVDYQIKNTQKAGLKEVTYARTSRLITIKDKLAIRKLGKLDDDDFETIIDKVKTLIEESRS